ncbi:hypothetical protein FACS18949_06490 [Clostridia bacterium]|nr:hypothetical protein FACS18949_06490 [Clostridia bacterium]
MSGGGFPSRETAARVQAEFPPGTRVELISMDDPHTKLKSGDRGSVAFVDDTATCHIVWDCGSRLGAVYGVDVVRKL